MRLAVITLAAVLALQFASAELVIESAERQITATTNRVSSNALLTIKNTGAAAVEEVAVCEQAALKEHTALFSVGTEVAGKVQELAVDGSAATVAGTPAGVACASYTLPTALAPGASVSLLVKQVFIKVLRPDPSEVAQGEPQRVSLALPLYVVSPYRAVTQVTKLELGPGKVEAYAKQPAHVKLAKGGKLTYGPYADVEPFATGEITAHYENDSPFAEAPEVVRDIEISHWGNVYFEERYTLRNAGAKVKGEWSRLDYMSKPDAGRAAIKEVHATLMPLAHSIYFRDGIGNISSSAVRHDTTATMVALQPRYPIFGGWSAKFIFGWSLPLSMAISKGKGSTYALSMLVGPSVTQLVVDDLTVKVVLPEGATFVKYECRLELEESFEKKYTYFDIWGRTVVVLRLRNMVPDMNVPLVVTYTYPTSAMLQKPLLLVAVFAVFFLVLMAYSRFDFRINSGGSSGKKKAS